MSTLRLIKYSSPAFYGGIVGFLSLATLFVLLARRSGLLRGGDSNQPDHTRPYSLARCQMALWFFTVLGAFLFLWMVTKTIDVIPTSVIALMGISLATGVAAATIDLSKRSALISERDTLVAKPALSATEVARVHTIDRELRGPAHEMWLTDILSDADGISFHRFQMFGWTLVLWLIFVAAVMRQLMMPEYSDQLLGLLGLSGGTYLGFKFPEQKA